MTAAVLGHAGIRVVGIHYEYFSMASNMVAVSISGTAVIRKAKEDDNATTSFTAFSFPSQHPPIYPPQKSYREERSP